MVRTQGNIRDVARRITDATGMGDNLIPRPGFSMLVAPDHATARGHRTRDVARVPMKAPHLRRRIGRTLECPPFRSIAECKAMRRFTSAARARAPCPSP